MKKLILPFALTLVALKICLAQAGILDITFGGDGRVTTSVGVDWCKGYSAAVQTDGKIIVAGVADNEFALVRYNPDGSLDNGFGTNGVVTTNFGTGSAEVTAIVIQPNGRIIAGGSLDLIVSDFALARYNSDGSLDNSFSTDGILTTEFGNYTNDIAHSLVLQLDGKIVLGGGSDGSFALARYNQNGSLDESFGAGGKLTTSFTEGAAAFSIALQSDGKIVAVGGVGENNFDFALARYNQNGTLDDSFGTGGKIRTSITPNFDAAYSVAIQPDDKILAAGVGTTSEPYDFVLARYGANGILDNSFGSSGIVATDFGDGDIAWSITLQPDGKIIASGASFPNFALARYNADGSLDPSFSGDGKRETQFPNGESESHSVILQPDGKILSVGFGYLNHQYVFALARYLSGLEVGTIDFFADDNAVLIYPNPIYAQAILSYELLQSERISFILYNVDGKAIRSFLVNGYRAAGKHEEQLDFSTIPSGIYYLTIGSGKALSTIKVVKMN